MQNEQKTSNNKAKNLAIFLSALCETGQTSAGEAIGRDASFMSRLKSGEKSINLDEFITLLDTLQLELHHTNQDEVKVNNDVYESLITLSQLGLKQLNVRG